MPKVILLVIPSLLFIGTVTVLFFLNPYLAMPLFIPIFAAKVIGVYYLLLLFVAAFFANIA